jgi:ubiquitin-associated and SH3 domain-containing protein
VNDFKVHDENAPLVMQILKELAGQHPLLEIGDQMKLKTSYTSQNFMGFFVNDEAATKLKRMAMQFVQKVSTSGNGDDIMFIRVVILSNGFYLSTLNYKSRADAQTSRRLYHKILVILIHLFVLAVFVEPHVKSLHLTLAYQFQTNQCNGLQKLVKELTPSPACWELRLYSRDQRIAGHQVRLQLRSVSQTFMRTAVNRIFSR